MSKHGHEHHHSQDHHHNHADGHDHQHHGPLGHHHHHASIDNLKVALLLNLSFSVLEFAGGLWTGSVAILADAVHDFGDAMSLGLAVVMERMAARRSDATYSYGYRRWSLLSAALTSAFLVGASIFVLVEAVPRLMNPTMPKLQGMLGFALLGIAVNGYAAWRTSHGATMNERVVSWHMIEDVLGWVAVLIGTLVMMVADLPIVDPILSIVFTFVILWGVLRNLRATLRLFLQGSPESIDMTKLRSQILAVDGVRGLHDVHIWSLDGAAHVLTLHLVVARESSFTALDGIKGRVRTIASSFGKIHTTIEIESEDVTCVTDCEDVSAKKT